MAALKYVMFVCAQRVKSFFSGSLSLAGFDGFSCVITGKCISVTNQDRFLGHHYRYVSYVLVEGCWAVLCLFGVCYVDGD